MIVLVRNLRVAVFAVRDVVTVIIRIRHIRVTVVIGVQLEVRVRLVFATVRVGHRDRNIELLNGVLVQLRLVRERNGDLTGVLVDRDDVALRSSEAISDLELRPLRSLRVLTVLIGEGRRRLGLLTRNNQLALVRRLVVLAVDGFELNEEVRRVARDLNLSAVAELAILLELQFILVDVVEAGDRNRVLALRDVLQAKVLNNRVVLGSAPGFTVVVRLVLGSVFRGERHNNIAHRLREFVSGGVVAIRLDDVAVDLDTEGHVLRVSLRCTRVVCYTVVVTVGVRCNTVTIVILHNVDFGFNLVDRAVRVGHSHRNRDHIADLGIRWNRDDQ